MSRVTSVSYHFSLLSLTIKLNILAKDKVPDNLKRLVRLTGRAFYKPLQIVCLDILTTYPWYEMQVGIIFDRILNMKKGTHGFMTDNYLSCNRCVYCISKPKVTHMH